MSSKVLFPSGQPADLSKSEEKPKKICPFMSGPLLFNSPGKLAGQVQINIQLYTQPCVEAACQCWNDQARACGVNSRPPLVINADGMQ